MLSLLNLLPEEIIPVHRKRTFTVLMYMYIEFLKFAS